VCLERRRSGISLLYTICVSHSIFRTGSSFRVASDGMVIDAILPEEVIRAPTPVHDNGMGRYIESKFVLG